MKVNTSHIIKHGLDFNRITKNIYIGTNFCCQIHFDKKLIAKGINADISLEKVRLDQPFGVQYYLWIPVRDHYAPKTVQLALGVQMLALMDKEGIQTYVHCKNGHGRAPTLVAAYLIAQGIPAKKAVKYIKQKRSVIHLTEKQVNALKRFEKYVVKHAFEICPSCNRARLTENCLNCGR